MALLFGRRIQVAVAGLEITDLRINVLIQKQIDSTQDKGTVSVFNLSPEHAQRIYERGGPITVTAGYPETLAIVFEGVVQRVRRERAQLSHITEIQVGDHVHQPDRLGGWYVQSLAGPIFVRTIAVDIIRNGLEMEHGPLTAIPEFAVWRNGESYYWANRADSALSVLLSTLPGRVTWRAEDGLIQLNRAGVADQHASTIQVSPDTGLIDRAIETDEGAEARLFLEPRIVLGTVLEIESTGLSGSYKVVGLEHTADNWEGKFETFCDLRAL